MYKNLKGLIALTAITSIGIGSVLHNQVAYAQDQEISSSQTTTTPSSVQVNIEDQSNNNNEIYVENYIDEKEVTTPGGAEINDIPAEIQQKYSDYFESNKDVKSIEDIINKLFKSLNDIDVKNNPNFSSLKDGEVPYSILSDIQKDGYSLDDKTMNSIKDSTDFFDVYSELSKDGGYVYHSYSSSSDFESVDDIVSNFLFKYDYTKIVDPEQFKQEIETKLNNGKLQ
ncbi:hypothetical protein OD350_29015 (plasmid) [Clostridium beijerinckii]|uniref:hypothetical protein n=1 Tax=Clostridium beijerinckii TaxID=1520 RepID=UPI002227ED52|nr:hypothetical protein [Clostridium beijerinckii]UYZ39116.1 hypothetical protein OD350_29015 [Clostridium beijerinckii]